LQGCVIASAYRSRGAGQIEDGPRLSGVSEPVGRCSPHSMVWPNRKARPGPFACRVKPFVDI